MLIDEYDMPIHAGFNNHFYDEIIEFMRNFLSNAFKDNPHLEKGVLTGIMRIAKESIFSGFNNLLALTILDDKCADYFGFTEPEVIGVLEHIGHTEQLDEIRNWYNGYRIGPYTMYNPWSIMNVAFRPDAPLQSHWVNTSDNQLIRDLITGPNGYRFQSETERLIRSESIEVEMETIIVLQDLPDQALWSMLLFGGYLTPRKIEWRPAGPFCTLGIPNLEVHVFFEKFIRQWFQKQTRTQSLTPVLGALVRGKFDLFAMLFADLVKNALSYHDTTGNPPERIYHVFLLGMLVHLQQSWRVTSNRESGYGRYDIMLFPKESGQSGFIFEFKQTEKDLETAADEALTQIQNRDYSAELREAGVQTIRAIGVAFRGKEVLVKTTALS